MTIQTDVSTTPNGMSDDAAVAALINQMKVDPKGPAANSGEEDEDPADADEGDELEDTVTLDEEDDGEADPDEDGEDDDGADEGNEGEEDDGEDEVTPPAAAAPADDAVVKVVVNGEETEVTVGSLKRLAGQEAALTRKSQEADQVGGRAAAMIQGALHAIMEDLEPYKDVDWLVAQQEMEPEEFKWHRENYARSNQRYQGLIKQAGEFEQVVTQRKQAARTEQVQEATAELSKDIPGWSDKLYGDILKYGAAQGLDPDDLAGITNAKVIKIIHKAMLADTATAVVAKKVNLTPRTRKVEGEERIGTKNNRQQRQLEQKLKTGRATDDDAVALLMGRWKK